MSTSFFVPQEGTLPLYEQIYRRMVEEIPQRPPGRRRACSLQAAAVRPAGGEPVHGGDSLRHAGGRRVSAIQAQERVPGVLPAAPGCPGGLGPAASRPCTRSGGSRPQRRVLHRRRGHPHLPLLGVGQPDPRGPEGPGAAPAGRPSGGFASAGGSVRLSPVLPGRAVPQRAGGGGRWHGVPAQCALPAL